MADKYGDLTRSQTTAICNKLGGVEGVKRFLRNETVVVERGKEKEPLPPVPTFSLAATFLFNPSVKIFYIGDNFRAWAPMMSQEPAPPEELKFQQLKRDMSGEELVELAGGVQKAVTPAEIWRLMERQPKGETGDLFVNGRANLSVVRLNQPDGSTRFCVVCVKCGVVGWHVDARDLSDRWYGDDRLFSRN